jgi:prepilin-type N-terminal cleavage/methylation domain-containing protein/prepilin-type processing-associated H-X9-DG protein
MHSHLHHRHALRPGLTLLEILVVITIIGILVGILLPAAHSMRAAARSTVCLGHQRQIALAGVLYANDHRGGLPATRIATGDYWFNLITPYLDIRKNTTPDVGFEGTAIRGCPEFVYKPEVLYRYSYGINAYLRYGDGGVDERGVSVNQIHNRIGGTSDPLKFREFRVTQVRKPESRLYLADQDAFWTGANTASWQPTGPDMRHRGRMALTFVDGHAFLGTAENYLSAQLSP